MFTVDGLPILVDDMEVIRTLRDQLGMQGIVRFRNIRRTYNNIMVSCPFHSDGQEQHPSFGISTVEKDGKPAGQCHCFACHYKGSLNDMISRCFGYDDKGEFGRRWLIQNFVSFETSDREILLDFSRDTDEVEEEQVFVSEEELKTYRFYHPYMFRRKLTEDVINKFDVGYDKKRDSITFPVRDEQGRTLFVGTRSVKGKNFFYPPGVRKPVYGLFEIKGLDLDELWICESQFNALTCWVYGKPAVALMGTGDEWQYEQLRNLSCRKIVLALDPDKAGFKGCVKLKYALKNKLIYRANVPFGKDINDLSRDEFDNLEVNLF